MLTPSASPCLPSRSARSEAHRWQIIQGLVLSALFSSSFEGEGAVVHPRAIDTLPYVAETELGIANAGQICACW
jgi:hypothetical protein